MVYQHFQMEENIWGFGKMIKCLEKESILINMVRNQKEYGLNKMGKSIGKIIVITLSKIFMNSIKLKVAQ